MENTLFAKLPNRLFYTKTPQGELNLNGDINISENEYDERLVSILSYLLINKNMKNICATSIERIVISCGMKPDNHKGYSNDKVKESIQYLVEKGYIISIDSDITKAKPKDCILFQLEDIDGNFSMLYEDDIELIINNKQKGIINTKLLTLFAFTNQSIHKPSEENKNDSQARVGFSGYDIISDRIGLSDNTITKYNDILVEMDLLTIFNGGRYTLVGTKDNKSRKLPNIYTLNRNGCMQDDYNQWKDDYKKTFPNRKIVKDMTMQEKKFNGLKGSLIKKEINGSITIEEKEKLNTMQKVEVVEDIILTADEKYNGIDEEVENAIEEISIEDISVEDERDNPFEQKKHRDTSFHYTDTSNEECLDFAMAKRKKRLAEEKQKLEEKNGCKVSELF